MHVMPTSTSDGKSQQNACAKADRSLLAVVSKKVYLHELCVLSDLNSIE